ncbi:MAG: biotin--[acetyl-CoA-carboxylase] ligase, partial [Pseudomonadota bacterium]
APVRSGLCMSFGFRFGRPIDQLGPLSLAIGVAVVEALRKQAGPGLGLKWPNDLMHQGDKLGGLLIEAQPDRSNGTRAVIGLGLNVNLPDHVHRTEPAVNDRLEGRGWTDLRSVNDRDWSRTELAIDLALAVDRACERYLELGFAPFYQRWASVDALVGQWVTAESVSQDPIEGFARGVNDLGELLIETESGWVSMSAGEVSVRFRTQAENDLRQ